MCSCRQYSHITTHVGKFCWHIEWIIDRIAVEMAQTTVDSNSSSNNNNNNNNNNMGVDNHLRELEVNDNEVEGKKDTQHMSLNKQMKRLKVLAISNAVVEDSSTTNYRVTRSQIRPVILGGLELGVSKVQKKVQNDVDDWEVQEILGRRLGPKTNTFEYLVKWKGWDQKWNSWVSVNNMSCDDLIENFERNHVGDDGLQAAMIACGFVALTSNSII
jgi:hypothetical protein